MNCTAVLDTSGSPTPNTALERVQQDSYLEQSGSTSVNSPTYVPVLSGDVEILYNTSLYGSATIPLQATASNTALCRISLDGAELGNSETTRTLTAGASGNVLLTSEQESVTPGNYTFGIECKRSGSTGAFSIENATMYIHVLSTEAGVQLEAVNNTITSSAISGTFGTFAINTSENQTDTGYTRALVLEWTAEYDYTATENMSVTPVLAGTNCTPVTRYGTTGSTGNVAGVCYRSGLTNSTEYEASFIGSGSGNIENAVFHLKEMILHSAEINGTVLSGIEMNQSGFQNLSQHNVTVNGGHSSPHFVSEVVVSVLSLNGSTSPSFYLTDGTTSTNIVQRTVGAGEPGVIGIQAQYVNKTGTTTMSLVGDCPNQNCSLTGVEFVSYMTNELPITPNSFFITLNDTYNHTAFTNFDVRVGNVTFETITGELELVTEELLLNISFPATNTTTVLYFANDTQNHDTSTNLTIQATPWTMIYAQEPDADPVYNFTITWIDLNNTDHNGSYNTTNGVAYVPVFNSTWQINITNAVGEDGTNFAVDTYEVNTTGYLQNYTFPLLVANSVNITFYDEETEGIIDFTNVTLEWFSDSGSSGNSTTSTGVMFVNLLLPETYTFIYDALGYDQRFFEYTLVNETFNNINLTLLNSSSSSTVTITVKDTLDNRLENAVVKILKLDVADNEYKLVEVRRTNFEGQTIAGMVLNNPLYKFIIEYEGEIVLTTTGTQIYGTSLTLIVNLITESGFEEVFDSYRLSGSVTFDNSTNLFTFNYDDESNAGKQACLTAWRVGTSRTNYNQSCSTVSSGTLTVSVANVSGRSYQAIGTMTDQNGFTHTIDSAWAVFSETISDDGSSLIMMIIMIIIFATALAVSVEIALVGAFAVPVIFTATGLTALTYAVTVPLLVVGVILAFIIGVIKR